MGFCGGDNDDDCCDLAFRKGMQKGIEAELRFRWTRLSKRVREERNVFVAMRIQSAAIEVWTELESLPWRRS